MLPENKENMDHAGETLSKISLSLRHPYLTVEHLETLKECLEGIVFVIDKTINIEKSLIK